MKTLLKKISSIFLVLCLSLVMPLSIFATTSEVTENSESIYTPKIEETGIIRTCSVYDNDFKLISKSSYNLLTGELETYDFITGNSFKQQLSTEYPIYDDFYQSFYSDYNLPALTAIKYKYVTTHTGSLKYASYTAAAIAGAIAVLVPGAGWGAIVGLANAIIAGNVTNLKYTVDIYMANSGNTYYTKRVFKAYDKYNGAKVGPTITGYSTSHHR